MTTTKSGCNVLLCEYLNKAKRECVLLARLCI